MLNASKLSREFEIFSNYLINVSDFGNAVRRENVSKNCHQNTIGLTGKQNALSTAVSSVKCFQNCLENSSFSASI